MRSYWTYILASKPRGTLYIGVTNGLPACAEQHRAGIGSVFTRKYGVHTLVWFEEFADVTTRSGVAVIAPGPSPEL
jgi:putative endonuclease